MEIYERIELRWKICLPVEFKVLSESGALDSENLNYLRLTDVRWFHLSKVLEQDTPDSWLDGIVPFGRLLCGDRVCWATQLAASVSGTPVLVCHHDSFEATVYAANFCAAVYRIVLEEFSRSVLADSAAEFKSVFRDCVSRVRPIMRPSWLHTLEHLADREPEFYDGAGFVLDSDELDLIISRDLGFPLLNSSIRYTK